MSTLLTKPISRQLIKSDRFGAIIVTLEPGDLISFRNKGKRITQTVSLHNVKTLALMQFILENHKTKMEEYTRKRKAGYPRLRKPKPPTLDCFSKIYRQAIAG